MLKPLTSLRFVFAFMVFCCHSSFLQYGGSTFSKWLYLNVLLEGYVGVSFFFILSGFILSYNYQNALISGTRRLDDFIIARIARIYPLHLLCCFAAIPIVFYVNLSKEGLASLLVKLFLNISLLHSFIPIQSIYASYNVPDWSISNELFFYFCFPFIIYAIAQTKKKKQYLLLPLVGAIGLLIVLMQQIPTAWHHALFYIHPVFRLLDFCLGILLYNIFCRIPATVFRLNFHILEVLALAFFICFLYFHQSVPQVYRYSVYYWLPMLFLIGVFAFQGGFVSRLLSSYFLIFLGEISFAFYLIHQLVMRYFKLLNGHLFQIENLILHWLIVLFLSLLLSSLSFFYFEKPLNRILKKHMKNWLKQLSIK